jgi:hypothetical protein
LQPPERPFEHLGRRGGLEARGRRAANGRLAPPVAERSHQIGPGEDAHQTTAFDHREVLLKALEDVIDRALQRVVRRERLESRDHHPADRDAGERRLELDHRRFGSRADPDEQRDEDQEGVGEESDQSEHQGEATADLGRDPRRPDVVHAQGEQRTQDPAPVHRKGREQIEHGERDVDPREPADEAAVERWNRGKRRRRHRRRHQREEQHGQPDVDGRSREGDEQLLPRVIGHALEPGDATDRQQRDVAGTDPVASRRQRVPQLVKHDDDEQRDDEDEARRRVDPAMALEIVTDADPRQEDEKRPVHVHVDPRDPAELPRPARQHDSASSRTTPRLTPPRRSPRRSRRGRAPAGAVARRRGGANCT